MTAAEPGTASRNWPIFIEVTTLIVFAIGTFVLVGWALERTVMTSMAAGPVAMNPMAAVTLLLAALSLWLETRHSPGAETKLEGFKAVLAVLILLVGLLRLAEYFGVIGFRIDQLLFASKLKATGSLVVNRMPVITGLGFFLCGIALLLFRFETCRGRWPSQGFVLGTGLIAILGLVDYCYRAFSLYPSGSIMPMSLGTASGLAMWSLGALAARPDKGIMQAIQSPTAGGVMARRLLPMALLVPGMLGALRLLGEKGGYFETESGVAIFAVAGMFIFATLIWWNAKLLVQADLERAKTEKRLALQYNSTRVLAESQEKSKALPEILEAICESLSWRLGAAWIVNKDAKLLECADVWQAPIAGLERFVAATRKTTFTMGIGLPGRVWETGRPVWLDDVTMDRNFPRAEAAANAGLHGAFGFPIQAGSTILGVLEFFSTRIEAPDTTLMELLESIGIQIGQFFERQRAQDELRLMTSKLARSNTDLQQFASLASHDLVEPLRMVTSFIELLQHHCEGKLDKQSEEFIQFALDGARRMKALINDLLAYSRVDRQTTELEPTNFEQAFNAAVGNLKVTIEENAATITHEPLPTIRGDAIQVTQVFQNLLGNAIKFHGADPPRIHVTADQKNGEWLFSVRDNGIGIEPKHFGRIFEIFQRLHRRREYPGTGMGLAICKRIIERHGGKMWVESVPGNGSTFFFTLPALRQN